IIGRRSLSAHGAALVALARGAQLLVGVNAGVVAVAPNRRQAIAPDRLKLVDRRLLLAELGRLVHAAFLAAFARAPGAGAGAAQWLVGMDALVAVGPGDTQLTAILVKLV